MDAFIGVGRAKSRQILNHIIFMIAEALHRGESVKIARFGRWKKVTIPPRTVKLSGVPYDLPARTYVSFKPSPQLRYMANEGFYLGPRSYDDPIP